MNQIEIGEKQVPFLACCGGVVYHIYQFLIVFIGILAAQHPFMVLYLLLDGEQYLVVLYNRHGRLRQFLAFELYFVIEPFVFKFNDLLFALFDDMLLLAQRSPAYACIDSNEDDCQQTEIADIGP